MLEPKQLGLWISLNQQNMDLMRWGNEFPIFIGV
jgi:hypothetical protein